MSTELSTLNSANFAEMAVAMGMGADMEKSSSKSSTLPRLRIWNQAVMGQVEVKGKMKNMEVIPSGVYRLQLPDDRFIYAEKARIRVFVQRFMYKRYDSDNNIYIKTLMAGDLNGDLKDNVGGLNCGKPAGYVEDFQSLPDDMKTLIKQVKRVRVLLGEVELINPVDNNGNDVEAKTYPFIWEIDNREGFKNLGSPFTLMTKQKRLPVQHWIECSSEERSMATGAKYYVPNAQLLLSETIDLSDEDQQKFSDFMEWINNYNDYILKTWNDKLQERNDAEMNASIVDQFINVDEE